jgi:2-methylcitrate dehydratase PrpD
VDESTYLGQTEELLSFVHAISIEDVPTSTLERATDLLLDHLGVSLFGSTMEWAKIVRAVVGGEGSAPESTVYGGRKTNARAAALINGCAAHSIELDDTHDESLSHPGAAIIPAALALGELHKRSGPQLLLAMIAGYEAMGRIGNATAKDLLQNGFHPTAQLGVFGATAASARILQLDMKQLTRAFGVAASMNSGSLKFTQDPEGTMVKRLHAGLPAERGVLAAQLASHGFTGPRAAIEGTFGFATIYTEVRDLSPMISGLGATFEVDNISVKLYSCCRMFHSLIEAIAECRAQPGFSVAKIAKITTFGPKKMIDGHLEHRPLSTMSAQYSLPYTVAVATLSDPGNPASFSEDQTSRPDLLSLADKIDARVAGEFEAVYPRRVSARVVFEMQDGLVFESTKLDSRSTPLNPISQEELRDKFRRVTKGILLPDHQKHLIEAVDRLEKSPDLDSLTRWLKEIDFPEHPALAAG